MFLSDDELYELTGYKRPARQRRALAQMGVPHLVRPDGKPRVLRSAIGDSPVEVRRLQEPDFEALS